MPEVRVLSNNRMELPLYDNKIIAGKTVGPFIRGKIRRVLHKTRLGHAQIAYQWIGITLSQEKNPFGLFAKFLTMQYNNLPYCF